MSESLVAELRKQIEEWREIAKTSSYAWLYRDRCDELAALLAKQEAPTERDTVVRIGRSMQKRIKAQGGHANDIFEHFDIPEGETVPAAKQEATLPSQTVLIVGESAIRAHAIKKIIEGDYKVSGAPVTQLELEPTPYQQFANELRDYKFTDMEIPEGDVKPAARASHVEAGPPDDENYVAFLRYGRNGSISTCDSDSEKAFKVWRHPQKEHGYMPTMDQAIRFIKSNPLTAAEILTEAAGPELSATEMRERCAAIPKQWVDGLSCTPETPCEHQRVANTIEELIRALSTRRG